jgi:hypothetical protein
MWTICSTRIRWTSLCKFPSPFLRKSLSGRKETFWGHLFPSDSNRENLLSWKSQRQTRRENSLSSCITIRLQNYGIFKESFRENEEKLFTREMRSKLCVYSMITKQQFATENILKSVQIAVLVPFIKSKEGINIWKLFQTSHQQL